MKFLRFVFPFLVCVLFLVIDMANCENEDEIGNRTDHLEAQFHVLISAPSFCPPDKRLDSKGNCRSIE